MGYTLFSQATAARSQAYWASLAGLVAAAWGFHVLVPAGVENRKLLIALPAMFILAGAGARLLGGWISPARRSQAAAIVFAAIAIFSIVSSLPLNAKPQFGFVPIAASLDRMLPPQSAALLVSDATGEGSIISEIALRRPTPAVYLLRGTKFLVSEDWNAVDYRPHVRSAEDCARLLASVPVDVVLMDRRTTVRRQEYFNLMEAMLQIHSSEWRLTAEFQTPADSPHAVAVYQRSTGIGPVRSLPRWMIPKIRWVNY